MAIKVVKSNKAPKTVKPEVEEPTASQEAEPKTVKAKTSTVKKTIANPKASAKPTAGTKVTAGTKAKPTTTGSFLKKGKAAQEALAQEDQQAEERKEMRGNMRRFWLRSGNETIITFLDGELDEDGVLDAPIFYNHNVKTEINGISDRYNFVCVSEQEPCPLCEAGDRHSLVGALTIVEHVEFDTDDGTVVNPRRLFICKRSTLRDLQDAASELGGLRGAQFAVRRTGDRKPTVGDEFEYLGTLTEDEMAEHFPESEAADYEKEIPYFTAEQLVTRGVIDGMNGGSAGGYDDYSQPAQKIGKAPTKAGLPSNFEENL